MSSDIIEINVNLSPMTRRHLGKLLAAAASAMPAFGKAEHNMFLALNSVLLSGRVGWPEFPHIASEVGWPGTDIMLKPAMAAGVKATNQLLSELNLLPAAIDFPVEFRKDEATFQAGLDALPQSAEFASKINCPRMVTYIMSSSDTPKEQLRALYKKRFTQCAEVMAKYDVRLGLEFLGPLQFRKLFKYEFIWRMNDMLELAKECGPNVGLLLDVWHWHLAGGTTQDIINAGRQRIVHVHFSDAPNLPPEQIRDNERLLPGEGIIDLTAFLRALQQIGYRDAVSVEVFGRLKNVPPLEAAKMGLDASLKVFRKAGVPEG